MRGGQGSEPENRAYNASQRKIAMEPRPESHFFRISPIFFPKHSTVFNEIQTMICPGGASGRCTTLSVNLFNRIGRYHNRSPIRVPLAWPCRQHTTGTTEALWRRGFSPPAEGTLVSILSYLFHRAWWGVTDSCLSLRRGVLQRPILNDIAPNVDRRVTMAGRGTRIMF